MKFIVTGFILWASIYDAQAQNLPGSVPKIEDLIKIPPSPEAQAFAKFGNNAVNFYTGTPEISIPIHSIQGREITVPISLSYDASGVKVEQISTWVGLGWNLSIGGMVTRQANGNPDDYLAAFPAYFPFYTSSVSPEYEFVKGFTPVENSNYTPGNLARYFNFMKRIVKEQVSDKLEIQPDTYSFNALGVSGTLIIDYAAGTAWCIEHPEILAVPTFQNQGTIPVKLIVGWTITDASGNVYYFNQAETTSVTDNNSAESSKSYYSSWLLTKVESKNKRDVVDFEYLPGGAWVQDQLAGRGSTRVDYPTAAYGNDLTIPAGDPTYKITQSDLTSISINGIMEVQLNQSSQTRSDLQGRKSLISIRINDQAGAQVKRYDFIQSYFGDPLAGDEKAVRLRLDRVEIQGKTTLPNPQTYKFDYLSGSLPSRQSMAQDYWGYFNNANNNTLIPKNYAYDKVNTGINAFVPADRVPSLASAQIGTLNKITYPTGGSSEFTYALNKSAGTSYSYTEDYLVGGASLLGAGSLTPAAGLEAPCEPDKVFYAKHQTVPLSIPTSGQYEINFQASGTVDGNSSMQTRFLAIYNTLDANGVPVNYGINSHESDCYILNNNSVLQASYPAGFPYVILSSSNYTQTLNVSLAAGLYIILIVNSDPLVTLAVNVNGTRNIVGNTVGGLRTKRVVDKDETGTVASNRYFYYNDLSLVSPSTITESWLMSDALPTTGSLHTTLQFDDEQNATSSNPGSGSSPGSNTRTGNNRVQAQYLITYPVVSEVQFSNNGLTGFTGYTVHEFFDQVDNYVQGYSKSALRNGRPTDKRVYDKSGTLLTMEQSFHSQQALNNTHGFYFNSTLQFDQDLYVRALISDPSQQSFTYINPLWILNGGESWTATHCVDNGIVCSMFSDTNYHIPTPFTVGADIITSPSHIGSDCTNWPAWTFNQSHPAITFQNQLIGQGIQNVTRQHYNSSGIVGVCRPVYTIISCYDLGSKFQKGDYFLPKYWVRTDSVRTVQYNAAGSIESVSHSYFDNNLHYQVTRMESKDSKGTLHTTKLYYPQEMLTILPSDPSWAGLISQNRIAEPVRKESYVNSTQLLATENTLYKTVGTMIVPDVQQFSTGINSLENRIQFSQYDAVGNPVEVSRVNDLKMAVKFGYNNMMAICQTKNASVNQIFHTSFEGEEGGNSSLDDSRTGHTSRTGGYSKPLSNLTANITYKLTYWQKNGGVWSYQTLDVPLGASTTYTISLTGQVDEVRFYPKGAQMSTFTYDPGIGVTSVTDNNNVTTYYQYDTLGRLVVVRDDKANILKTFRYEYFKAP